MKVRAILLFFALVAFATFDHAQSPQSDAPAPLQARAQNVRLVQTIPEALEVRPVFTPDSSKVIYCRQGFYNPYPAVWNVKAGALETEEKKIPWCGDYSFAPDGSIRAIEFSGNRLGMNWMEIHDLASGRELNKLKLPGERYFFEPGDSVALLSIHKQLALWDLANNSLVHQFDLPSEGAIVRIVPGSKMVLTYYPNGDSVSLWNGETGTLLHSFPSPARLMGWNVSHDGHLLATAYPGTVLIWEIASGKTLQTLNTGIHRIFSLAFFPDNRVLASIDEEGSIGFWDAASGSQIGSLPTATSPFARMQLSPDGQFLAATGPKGSKSVRVWQIPAN